MDMSGYRKFFSETRSMNFKYFDQKHFKLPGVKITGLVEGQIGFQKGLPSPKFCIIGTGFSGLCAAIKLHKEMGIDNFDIFEMNEDLGGTWLSNCYPGASSDIPIHAYCFSFEARADWRAQYATQMEVLNYLKEVATKYKLYSKIKFQHQVKRLTWDKESRQWEVVVEDMQSGQQIYTKYDFTINATGSLRLPKVPKEFDEFKGPKMHTATWDNSVDLKDKRIAVIGAGASAIQTIPEVAKLAKKLVVYQRKPSWIIPKFDYEFPCIVQKIFAKFPVLLMILRWIIFSTHEILWYAMKKDSWVSKLVTALAHWHRRHQLNNRADLIDKMTPKYPLGCQRTLTSKNYYPVFLQPHVTLITLPIEKITQDSIITEEGEEKLDVLILATGFRVTDYFAPMKIYDKNGEDVLVKWKKDAPSLFMGVLGNNLPNHFILYGPNTSTGHNSGVVTVEMQMDLVIKCLREMKIRNCRVISIKKSVEVDYMNDINEQFLQMVWSAALCSPWYADSQGRIVGVYPGNLQSYWKRIKNFDPAVNLELEC